MHAWEAIQKTLNHIEEHIDEEIQIEELAEIAGLSLFYYQRLFARLVKKPVREYIKLRRLARACSTLRDKENRIIGVQINRRTLETPIHFLGESRVDSGRLFFGDLLSRLIQRSLYGIVDPV
ncbi:Regulatory protein SoxS [compost metagenome]